MDAETVFAFTILHRENIRKMDGRYSGGFVNTDALGDLITMGKAETFSNYGVEFVRLSVSAAEADEPLPF